MPAHEANPIYPSEGERRDLEALVRQQACTQHVALRARIVLLASEGVGIQPGATRLGIARTAVRNWRRRWLVRTGNRVAERSLLSSTRGRSQLSRISAKTKNAARTSRLRYVDLA